MTTGESTRRRRTRRTEWQPSGAGVVLRVPLLPFDSLLRLLDSSGGGAPELDSTRRDDALRQLLLDPFVREAIFLASPSLDERTEEWLASADPAPESLARSLASYMTRMATRATPFGLFAAVAVARPAETSALSTADSLLLRRTRLDFGYLASALMKVQEDPEVRQALTYTRNSSLYRAGAKVRLLEASVAAGRVSYTRTAFDDDEALRLVLDAAGSGATLSELAELLVAEGAPPDEAAQYLDQMVADQLLVPELGPVLTGGDAAQQAAQALPGHHPFAKTLTSVNKQLRSFDLQQAHVAPAEYRAVAEELSVLDVPFELSRLFQVDAALTSETLTLSRSVIDTLCSAIPLLAAVSATGGDELADFRTAFTRRFGEGEVPLPEVLDEEVGIPFGAGISLRAEGKPLLSELRAAGGSDSGGRFTPADERRLRLLVKATTSGEHVELDDEDLAAMSTAAAPPLPDALALLAVLAAPSAAALDRGEFSALLKGAAGPSGARLLGRFCDTSPQLTDVVQDHLRAEERLRPDVVHAEVVHLPEGRVGNVVARPVLRDYEIVFLGTSGADRDRQIHVDELTVSVVGSRVVLRCPRLGCEVVPRNTTAHSTFGALPVYRFLAALQQQQVRPGLGWSWGPLGSLPFLPRVAYGRFVLSRARWNLGSEETKPLVGSDPAGRAGAVARLRDELGLPAWVTLVQGDNDLVLNLDSALGQQMLCHEARKGYLQLDEVWPAPDELCVSAANGHLMHELLVPIVRATNPAPEAVASARRREPAGAADRQQVFVPGSEWVSAKLYVGKATADTLLAEVVVPLVDELTRADTAASWFFLRFADPDWHVRLRLHSRQAPQALVSLHDAVQGFVEDGRVSRVEIDTYMPETARYGGAGAIGAVEQVFRHDSIASLACVALTRQDLSARWRLALLGIDQLLTDVGWTIETRRENVTAWRDGLVAEQGATGEAARKWAGKVMRSEGRELRALWSGEAASPVLEAGRLHLRRRSTNTQPLLHRLSDMSESGLLTSRLPAVMGSLCHMHVNRMLRGAHRTQELVLYDLLDRVYASAGARPSSARRP